MAKYIVSFEYMDRFSNGKWNSTEAHIDAKNEPEAIRKCKDWYGLDNEDVTVRSIKARELKEMTRVERE